MRPKLLHVLTFFACFASAAVTPAGPQPRKPSWHAYEVKTHSKSCPNFYWQAINRWNLRPEMCFRSHNLVTIIVINLIEPSLNLNSAKGDSLVSCGRLSLAESKSIGNCGQSSEYLSVSKGSKNGLDARRSSETIFYK